MTEGRTVFSMNSSFQLVALALTSSVNRIVLPYPHVHTRTDHAYAIRAECALVIVKTAYARGILWRHFGER
jgi:hypothetical protein